MKLYIFILGAILLGNAVSGSIWGGISNGISNGINGIENGISNGINGIENGISNGINGIENGISNGINGIENGISNGINGIENGISNGINGIENGISNGISSIEGALELPVESIMETINKINNFTCVFDIMDSTLEAVKEMSTEVLKCGDELEDDIKAIVESTKDIVCYAKEIQEIYNDYCKEKVNAECPTKMLKPIANIIKSATITTKKISALPYSPEPIVCGVLAVLSFGYKLTSLLLLELCPI